MRLARVGYRGVQAKDGCALPDRCAESVAVMEAKSEPDLGPSLRHR